MMPVCPVARKSASTPRREARARSPARCISCRARNRCRPSAAACRSACGRWRSGCRPAASRTSISRRPWRSATGSVRDVAKPGVHAADDVEPRFEGLEQGRDPVRAMMPPLLATPMTIARAPAAAPGPGRAGAGLVTLAPGRRTRRRTARPVPQAEGRLGEAGLGRVSQEQEIGRGEVEHSGAHGEGVAGDDAQPQKATSTARPRVRGCTGTVPMKPAIGRATCCS